LAVRVPMLRARVLPKYIGMRITCTQGRPASTSAEPSRLPASTTSTSSRSGSRLRAIASRQRSSASRQFRLTMTTETSGG